MRLRHLHLPCRAPSLYPPYGLASRVQEHLRRQLLDFKDRQDNTTATTTVSNTITCQPPPPGVTTTATAAALVPPPPTVLSFTPLPTFTLGRRQVAPLTESEVARLQAPLHLLNPPSPSPPPPPPSSPTPTPTPLPATVLNSPRGGLTTYHGPGQAVLWPVLDLRSAHHKQYTVRCYSRLLEDTTIATLGSLFSLTAFTTADPGVWVQSSTAAATATPSVQTKADSNSSTTTAAAAATTGDELRRPAKIAALGVHLRRHVSALGTAINVAMPGPDVTSEKANPWARIVACGLEGKTVTSVAGELSTSTTGSQPSAVPEEAVVAAAWVEELARRIGVDGAETVGLEETLALVEDVLHKSAGEEGGDAPSGQEKEYLAGVREMLSARQERR
ncbi:hypothetical protein B0T17DRAFT_522174 [Bombardia bombarda]|uniref:BPL/LPL catalytic domain-containing protein n=1 Tax=Bombardia bombarda TaxID=252184 RepID=A0AA39X797_9PEZI|nr:hypothetical protein B0T17DRAFT_522174 [Bombardia bombarda]